VTYEPYQPHRGHQPVTYYRTLSSTAASIRARDVEDAPHAEPEVTNEPALRRDPFRRTRSRKDSAPVGAPPIVVPLGIVAVLLGLLCAGLLVQRML
jgi:hypothetical protein